MFASPDSVIRANSRLDIDGTVEVNSLDTSRNFGLTSLPEMPLDNDSEFTQGCNLRSNNHFTYVDRGGLPATLFDSIATNLFLPDLGSPNSRQSSPANFDGTSTDSSSYVDFGNQDIVEAQAWKITLQGTIELIASKSGNFNQYENGHVCLKK